LNELFFYLGLALAPGDQFCRNFQKNVTAPKTRMMGLSDGKDRSTSAGVMQSQYQCVTDRRTDGQTDDLWL